MTTPPVVLSPAVFSSEVGRLAALRLRLGAIGGVLVLVALAVAMTLIWHEREAALADARTDGANLALVLARQADALLQATDGRMSGLRAHLAKGKGGSAGEEAEARLDSLAFAARLQRRAARLSPRQTLLAVTAEGRIAAASAVVMPCQAAWIGREVRALAAETADRPRLREVPAGCDPPALLLMRPLRMALRAPEAPASSPSGWGFPAPGSRFSGALVALIRPDDLLVFPPAITLAEAASSACSMPTAGHWYAATWAGPNSRRPGASRSRVRTAPSPSVLPSPCPGRTEEAPAWWPCTPWPIRRSRSPWGSIATRSWPDGGTMPA